MSGMCDDGGPAFPLSPSPDPDHYVVLPRIGMSLRDYFAAKALTLVAGYGKHTFDLDYERLARGAYQLADALLAERAKEPPQ